MRESEGECKGVRVRVREIEGQGEEEKRRMYRIEGNMIFLVVTQFVKKST